MHYRWAQRYASGNRVTRPWPIGWRLEETRCRSQSLKVEGDGLGNGLALDAILVDAGTGINLGPPKRGLI